MVNNTAQLNVVFHSLSDPIRRDIVFRVANGEKTVSELVSTYDVSFPAISKHLKVLEQAHLITKRKEGRQNFIVINHITLQQVDIYLEQYRRMWEQRYAKLNQLLKGE